MNKLAVFLWAALTVAGTWWLMSRDPELQLLPTAIFSGIVSAFLACLVTVLLSGLFSTKKTARKTTG